MARWVRRVASLPDMPQGILPGAFLNTFFRFPQVWLVSVPWASVSPLVQNSPGFFCRSLPVWRPWFYDPLAWAKAARRPGWGDAAKRVQESQATLLFSHQRLSALHQNDWVPVFASEGRNVTNAALSKLGRNSAWS